MVLPGTLEVKRITVQVLGRNFDDTTSLQNFPFVHVHVVRNVLLQLLFGDPSRHTGLEDGVPVDAGFSFFCSIVFLKIWLVFFLFSTNHGRVDHFQKLARFVPHQFHVSRSIIVCHLLFYQNLETADSFRSIRTENFCIHESFYSLLPRLLDQFF